MKPCGIMAIIILLLSTSVFADGFDMTFHERLERDFGRINIYHPELREKRRQASANSSAVPIDCSLAITNVPSGSICSVGPSYLVVDTPDLITISNFTGQQGIITFTQKDFSGQHVLLSYDLTSPLSFSMSQAQSSLTKNCYHRARFPLDTILDASLIGNMHKFGTPVKIDYSTVPE